MEGSGVGELSQVEGGVHGWRVAVSDVGERLLGEGSSLWWREAIAGGG